MGGWGVKEWSWVNVKGVITRGGGNGMGLGIRWMGVGERYII